MSLHTAWLSTSKKEKKESEDRDLSCALWHPVGFMVILSLWGPPFEALMQIWGNTSIGALYALCTALYAVFVLLHSSSEVGIHTAVESQYMCWKLSYAQGVFELICWRFWDCYSTVHNHRPSLVCVKCVYMCSLCTPAHFCDSFLAH